MEPPIINQETQPAPRETTPYSWKAGLLVAGVVVLVIIGYMTLLRHSGDQAAAMTDGQISITDHGFLPETVVVNRGRTITWINNDISPHWIMADPYPTGTSLPELDSTDVLAQNDSYSFTFATPGKYTYHDQLHPYMYHGTIEVK